MYSRIVTALDGSELGERVLPYVEELAGKFGSTVILLRATPTEALVAGTVLPLGSAVPIPSTAADVAPMVEAQQEEADQYLHAMAEKMRAKGLAVKIEMPQGQPAEAIVARANALDADLIAMTTHGRGGLARLFVGSVADEVVRTASCPVLLIRSREVKAR